MPDTILPQGAGYGVGEQQAYSLYSGEELMSVL